MRAAPARRAWGAPGGRGCRTGRARGPSSARPPATARTCAAGRNSPPPACARRGQRGRARSSARRGGAAPDLMPEAVRVHRGRVVVAGREDARPPGSPPGRAAYGASATSPTNGQREHREVRQQRRPDLRSGSAGETRVSVLSRSGRRAATRIETAPPIELPPGAPGPRSRASISRITVPASAVTEYPALAAGGGENPEPGRSTAAQSKSGASSAIRSVQLVAAPGHAVHAQHQLFAVLLAGRGGRLREPYLLAAREGDHPAGPVRDGVGHALAFLRPPRACALGRRGLPRPVLRLSLARFALAASTLARSVSVRSAGPPGFAGRRRGACRADHLVALDLGLHERLKGLPVRVLVQRRVEVLGHRVDQRRRHLELLDCGRPRPRRGT